MCLDIFDVKYLYMDVLVLVGFFVLILVYV